MLLIFLFNGSSIEYSYYISYSSITLSLPSEDELPPDEEPPLEEDPEPEEELPPLGLLFPVSTAELPEVDGAEAF